MLKISIEKPFIAGITVRPVITSASVSSTTPLPMNEMHIRNNKILVNIKKALSGSLTLKYLNAIQTATRTKIPAPMP